MTDEELVIAIHEGFRHVVNEEIRKAGRAIDARVIMAAAINVIGAVLDSHPKTERESMLKWLNLPSFFEQVMEVDDPKPRH